MLYEMRVYYGVPGRLSAMNDRFANHTVDLFKKHGIGMVGFWTEDVAANHQLIYMLSFDSMADRETRWSGFGADPEWLKVRAETEKDGPIVAYVQNSFMRLTPYSSEPRFTTDIQELRVYEAMPGKLPALNERFANHTDGLFKKHGMEVVGYWTDDVGTSNQLTYMLGFRDLGEREKSWKAFGGDPEWRKVVSESEKDGTLVKGTRITILRPTRYSPRN